MAEKQLRVDPSSLLLWPLLGQWAPHYAEVARLSSAVRGEKGMVGLRHAVALRVAAAAVVPVLSRAPAVQRKAEVRGLLRSGSQLLAWEGCSRHGYAQADLGILVASADPGVVVERALWWLQLQPEQGHPKKA